MIHSHISPPWRADILFPPSSLPFVLPTLPQGSLSNAPRLAVATAIVSLALSRQHITWQCFYVLLLFQLLLLPIDRTPAIISTPSVNSHMEIRLLLGRGL